MGEAENIFSALIFFVEISLRVPKEER